MTASPKSRGFDFLFPFISKWIIHVPLFDHRRPPVRSHTGDKKNSHWTCSGNSPGIHLPASFCGEGEAQGGACALRGEHVMLDQGRGDAARLTVADIQQLCDIASWEFRRGRGWLRALCLSLAAACLRGFPLRPRSGCGRAGRSGWTSFSMKSTWSMQVVRKNCGEFRQRLFGQMAPAVEIVAGARRRRPSAASCTGSRCGQGRGRSTRCHPCQAFRVAWHRTSAGRRGRCRPGTGESIAAGDARWLRR